MVLKLNLTRSTKNGNIKIPTPDHTKRQCLCCAITVFGAAARQGIVALWPAGPFLFSETSVDERITSCATRSANRPLYLLTFLSFYLFTFHFI